MMVGRGVVHSCMNAFALFADLIVLWWWVGVVLFYQIQWILSRQMILPVPGVCSKANPTLENLQEMDFDQEVEEPET